MCVCVRARVCVCVHETFGELSDLRMIHWLELFTSPYIPVRPVKASVGSPPGPYFIHTLRWMYTHTHRHTPSQNTSICLNAQHPCNLPVKWQDTKMIYLAQLDDSLQSLTLSTHGLDLYCHFHYSLIDDWPLSEKWLLVIFIMWHVS